MGVKKQRGHPEPKESDKGCHGLGVKTVGGKELTEQGVLPKVKG